MWLSTVWRSQFLALAFALLSTLVAARSLNGPHYRDEIFHPRADTTLDCHFFCEISEGSSCGTACGSPTKRHDLSGLAEAPDSALQAYNSTGDYYYYHSDPYIINEIRTESARRRSVLAERAFTSLNRRNTVRKIDDYVRQQNLAHDDSWGFKYDPQFPEQPLGFFTGKQNAAAQYSEFGTDTVQYGTNGLHGCTMMTVISKKAVYMAHYWESYSTGGDDELTADGTRRWTERVLDAITDTPVTNPFNPSDGKQPYRTPFGPGINWNLFNNPGDDTRVYFMTPLAEGVTDEASGDIAYPNKIGLVEQLLTQHIPNLSSITRYGYNRLRYRYVGGDKPYSGEDAKEVNRSARGMCLFQYDGASNWRLFYQYLMVSGTTT